MIRGGFLTEEDRGKLVALVRDGSAASRVTGCMFVTDRLAHDDAITPSRA
jgi:hypothetical protein